VKPTNLDGIRRVIKIMMVPIASVSGEWLCRWWYALALQKVIENSK
jgi:hypothetical protein